MSFDHYRDWLASHWSVSLSFHDAVMEPPHDPADFPPQDSGEIRENHATLSFVETMRRQKSLFPGKTAWEIGCGSGMIAVEAGRLGASRVAASDIDETAVELTRRNAEIEGISVETARADLFTGAPWKGPFDLLLALFPQKPCKPGELPLVNDGGPEGTRLLLPLIEEAPAWLTRSGHLFIFLHSLAHPGALVRLQNQYGVELLSLKKRIFSATDYPGIVDRWKERRKRNACYFEEREDGRLEFIAMILKARPNG